MQERNGVSSNVEPHTSVFNFEGFTAYLRTPAGGNRNKATARFITSDVIMFFSKTAQSSKENQCNIDRLFNKTNLVTPTPYQHRKELQTNNNNRKNKEAEVSNSIQYGHRQRSL